MAVDEYCLAEFERLPKNAKPTHYAIILIANMKDFVFHGNETIDLQVIEETDFLRMHSSSIEIQSASIKLQDNTEFSNLIVECNQQYETLSINLPQKIQPQNVTVSLKFNGIINESTRGFYRSSYIDQHDKLTYMACTQFESTFARQSFPCWDEPDYKATFDITLIVEKSLMALSNMHVIEEVMSDGDQKTLKFATTPLMSTYLVAFAIGDFEYVEDKTKDGVLIRVYAVAGKKDGCHFALSVCKKAIEWFGDWFSMPYPLSKCDLLAVPDFCNFAMENWGLITFRELVLVNDPQNTSKKLETTMALVIAHECAHMWFGNLVTMKWWTDLWLNEGFANFMEYVFVAENYPEYNVWYDFLKDVMASGFELDGMDSSHPIQMKIENPNEMDEFFDAITYKKSSSVLRMLCEYLGMETFRKGLQIYLERFQYDNAETIDLWNALSDASGKDMVSFMSNWTSQVGHPMIMVSISSNGDHGITLNIMQQKFCYKVVESQSDILWQVPLNISSVEKPELRKTLILRDHQGKFVLDEFNIDDCILCNTNIFGFYRVCYDCTADYFSVLYKKFCEGKLSCMDRFGLVNDIVSWLLCARYKVGIFLQLFEDMVDEKEYIVWSALNTGLAKLLNIASYYADDSVVERIRSYVVRNLESVGKRLTWHPLKSESFHQTYLRTLILARLGSCGHLPTIEVAQAKFREHVDKDVVLDPDLRMMVYSTVAVAGGESEYEDLKRIYAKAELDEIKRDCILAMTKIRDVNLLKQLFTYAIVMGKVRSQEYPLLFAGAGGNPVGQKFLWLYFKENVRMLIDKIGSVNCSMFINCFKESASWMCCKDSVEDVRSFVQSQLTEEAATLKNTTEQIIENIQINRQLLNYTENDIVKYLHGKGF